MENTIDEQAFDQIVQAEYETASNNRRFLNYIIDVIGYYAFAFLIGVVLSLINIYLIGNSDMLSDATASNSILIEYLFAIVVFLTYYTLLEYWTQGKTLGKLLTGTRAVMEDGRRISFETALKRSLSRIVPFEPFSFLGGTGWHDRWTDTKVIIDKGWNGR